MVRFEYLVNPAEAIAEPALGRAAQQAPFDRAEWWAMLCAECLPGEQPLIALARDGSALCAVPLMRRAGSGQLRSLANWYSFWARPVFAGGGERLLRDLAADLAGHAPRVSLSPVPEADAAAVARAFASAGWTVRAEQADLNHRLDLAGRDFATWWAGRPGQLRETVRRKRARGAVAIELFDRFDLAAWHAYETVYAQSWKPEEGSPAFLRRFAEAEGATGALRLGLARIDGAPVAAQLWTVEGGTAFIHKLAHVEAARAHSPGTLLSHAMFEHAIDHDRVTAIDFGTGDDPYKRDWMETVRPMLRLDMHRPRRPASWPHLLRNRFKGPGYSLAAVEAAG